MVVIPAINCPDIACAKEKISVARRFLGRGDYIHLDVTDGFFSDYPLWDDPAAWAELEAPFALEAHLMILHPEERIGLWLDGGAKRVIIHVEALTLDAAQVVAATCHEKKAAAMLAIKPETPYAVLEPYLDSFSAFQILAVSPGPAAQSFEASVIAKIQALRAAKPNAIIEVDGGMKPASAALVKAAGADVIVSSSYIFNSSNPKLAFEELKKI